MIDTSVQYKEMVYSREYARQFIPQVIVKVMDVFARQVCSYAASSKTFYSKLTELYDDQTICNGVYRTCEKDNFLLDGSAKLLEEGVIPEEQIGWVSDELCNDEGVFEPVQELVCTYSQIVTTPGRTIFFDTSVKAHPKDIDLTYYLNDTIIHTDNIRDIPGYYYTSMEGVIGYNKLVIGVLSMTDSLCRVRIIEDIPGLYMEFTDSDVVSITLTQAIDIFSLELLTGELDLVVKNDEKKIDILNPSGFNSYLQRRQPIEVYLTMSFPDGSKEPIKLGTLFITEWKATGSTLSARFVARDGLDKLYLAEYIKGVIPVTPISFYELAEAVLIDAGITDYEIDLALLNIYTFSCIPIVSHKEALRMIAQATQSVVLPLSNGGIKLKYIGIPVTWPVALDYLDYGNLFDSPDIELASPVKSVTSQIYQYTTAAVSSEIYKGTRTLNDTETFTVKFNKMACDCSIAVTAGTVNSVVYYSQAAVISMTLTGETTITISGKEISTNTCTYRVDNTLEPNLIPDALDVQIDNKLVTIKEVAQDMTSHAAYWYTRRYRYTFGWRQNPAIELWDPIKVHDDFDNDNTTMIIERNIDFQGGVLSGSSKAIV